MNYDETYLSDCLVEAEESLDEYIEGFAVSDAVMSVEGLEALNTHLFNLNI